MINNISGQAAVTSTSNNAPQKKEKNNMSSQSTSSNTGAQNTGLGNSAVSGSNMAAAANTTASNGMQQNSAIFISQNSSTNAGTSAGQAQGNNPDNVDYQKEALDKLITDLRKEYIKRNHYIDENTQISVLQIVNTETDHVIGQYPSDLYLSLLTKVRESQKQLVNQTI